MWIWFPTWLGCQIPNSVCWHCHCFIGHSKAIICKPSDSKWASQVSQIVLPKWYIQKGYLLDNIPNLYFQGVSFANRLTCLGDSLFQYPATNQPPSHSNTIPLLRLPEASQQWAVLWWTETAVDWWTVRSLLLSPLWIPSQSQSSWFESWVQRRVVSWLNWFGSQKAMGEKIEKIGDSLLLVRDLSCKGIEIDLKRTTVEPGLICFCCRNKHVGEKLFV